MQKVSSDVGHDSDAHFSPNGAEDSFSGHDWAVVEFLDKVKKQLITRKIEYWLDRCANSPDKILRHNLTQAFRYIVDLRKDYFAELDEVELIAALQREEPLSNKLLNRALETHGHLLFNSKYYGVVRAFGTTSLVPILPGRDAQGDEVTPAKIQEFFTRHGLPHFINPDFIATYESQLLPCNAGLTPYQVTLFTQQPRRVRRVTSIPYLLADLSILHKREDFVQGHLSALLAVLHDDGFGDSESPQSPLGAYVLTCVIPEAFSETDVWRLNQIVDSALTLGMLSTLQTKQERAPTRGAQADVLLEQGAEAEERDNAEDRENLREYLREAISSQLDSGLLALAASAGAEEARIRGAAVNFDGIYRLVETLFPEGPWLAPSLVSEARVPDGERNGSAESAPLDVRRLRTLCERMVAVFESDEATCSTAVEALIRDSPLFGDLIEAVFPEVRSAPDAGLPASLVRTWRFEDLASNYAVITIGGNGMAEPVRENLRLLIRLASLAAKLASMPEGENRIFADVKRAWTAGSSENGAPASAPVDVRAVIERAENLVSAMDGIGADRGEMAERHAASVAGVREAILAEIRTILSPPDSLRGVLLIRKRTIYVPEIEAWEDGDFRCRYLGYSSFWLFERLSQIFGKKFLDEVALTDPAIPRIGYFLRRQDHYPHVEVRASAQRRANDSASILLNFLGVPISRWHNGSDERVRVLVGDEWFHDFTAAYRNYLNLLMRSAPSLSSLSRVFGNELLSVHVKHGLEGPDDSCEQVDHHLVINRPDQEPERRVVSWRAHEAVEVECACLDHRGILGAWLDVSRADEPISTLCAGEQRVSPEFEESVRSDFKWAVNQIQAEQNAVKRKQSEELNRRGGDMMGIIAHDTSNLLHVVKGNVELFEEGIIDADHLIKIIKSQSEFLLLNLEGLLDLYKLDRGKWTFEPSDVSVSEAVGEVCGWYTDVAAKRKRYIVNLIAEGPYFQVVSDPLPLKRILANLIDNAIKYIPEEAKIFVDAVDEGELIDIRVRDTGEGITEEILIGLLEPWVRGGNERASGSGLGLHSARRISEAMHGTLDVESTVGVGTTFHLRLPKAEPPVAPYAESVNRRRK